MIKQRLTGLSLVVCIVVLSSLQIRAQTADRVLLERIDELERLVDSLRRRLDDLEEQSGANKDEKASGQESTQGAEPEVGDRSESPPDLRFYWREGLRAESREGSFRVQVGGRIMHDWAFLSGNDGIRGSFGSLRDGTEFRRSRLFVSGLIHDRVEFKAQYDFAGGEPEFKDVYLGLVELPVLGGLRVGHFKEPFSLEQLTSSKYITFMERSLPDVFAPSRNSGLMVHQQFRGERLTWASGIFRDADSFGDSSSDGDYSLTTRLTGLPWYEEEGKKLFHLGFAYSHRNPQGDVLRIRQRPEVHLAPRFVDTQSFAADSADLFGVETSLVYGSFSVQSEYVRSHVNTPVGPDLDFSGVYVQGSYFLTGEHRRYDREEGAFGRVRPRRNLFEGIRNAGAWEIAARYSRLDLNDRFVLGGELNNATVGLNWHLNPNTRMMWNYVFSDTSSVGEANMFQTRFQVDF